MQLLKGGNQTLVTFPNKPHPTAGVRSAKPKNESVPSGDRGAPNVDAQQDVNPDGGGCMQSKSYIVTRNSFPWLPRARDPASGSSRADVTASAPHVHYL
jgi:hypothetical protein